ncbi:hypothetical protein CXB51_033113 [Gossypium anomalum]|uniref:non-specific serine/threonine protein kinase n=1 Tax=Gossypium anomalum TaxID=47600 RepID=A0A8J6CQH0_9ROSI|nr:hypothetical protein CXB51_033113 [Gossypium anomalum]
MGQKSIVGTSSATSRSTNETETQVLLAIKARILIDPYEIFVSWNGSRHFCNWPGVTCGRRHRRVTALRLPSLNLVGDLSPYIANLTFLKVINVWNNSFRGPIPREVSRLYRLEELVLANNSFHGELPRHLAHCSNLKFVNLNRNALGGETHAELGSLSKLRMLQLAMNNFIGTIPPSIGNISSLQYLSLIQNQLEGHIPIELGHLSNLRFLQLATNKFSGTVPKELYNISSIFSFGLADNQLQGQVPPYISLSLPNLRFIYLGKNKFSGSIPTSIANATGLIQLDMGSNELSGPIPNLGSLQNLQALNFGDNFLDSSNDLSFLSSLTNCTNLSLLWLYKNNLTGVLPDSIGNLSTDLNQFRIETNFISGAIPKGIGNLVGLEYLGLFENMFTSTIPDSIGKISKLKYLYAYTNRITGEIPLSLGNMTQLIVLSIEDNLLQGNIPVTMGNFIHLEKLDLSQNRLNATIPKEVFGLCSSIMAVSFASNGLTGTLPSEVGNCKNLILLDVSNNNIYGEIPSSLENCLMLELFSLQGNSFNGTIPSSFKRLRSIQVLDLSNNDFSGRIPKFLAELPLATDLNLSFNMFEGEVPMNGVFGNISAFSVIGNNKLCGGIKPLRLPVCPRETETKGKNFPHKKEGIAFHLDKKHPKLSYAELLHATDGFSSANLIGKGRYGSVYKGTLTSDGQKPIAVKVLDLQQRGADQTFKSECQVLKNLKHRNLVKVITSCSSIDFQGNDFKALVFEFMPNGSLETWLHPSSTELNHSTSLNLTQRLKIAIDVALALDYLHSQFGKPVVHCDLKPSNVLLDGDLTAYVSDFGLTKFLTMTAEYSIGEQSSSIGIRGTMGYIPPEYGMGKEISTSGDVYSYGVLLMELFTGKRPTDSMFTGELSLRDYVKAALPDRAAEIADPWLNFENEAFDQNGQNSGGGTGNAGKWLGSVLGIGVACSADSPIERMIIGDVLRELHNVRNRLIGDHRRRRA